ncbi:hypothetical protein D9757_011545 [Collybiopsis confluens]|uniref:Heterokaryon incompatibility domain-containing protein n=1 Tax=Collybiopsis confluens TaxID=2823264 RepID=A0A8H5GAZ7_9AGAR|nr:hypothetical protein D9757_011545 [Collybiopsis confluens]
MSAISTIFQMPLAALVKDNLPLDLAAAGPTPATPQRYRLVRCKELVEDQTLCIDEFHDFPHIKYSAVSYVWRGNIVDRDFVHEQGRFNVKGAEDGDPIGVDVLSHACSASLLQGYSHLWLDRLCIIQTSKEDKRWQIQRMHSIYQSCALCIVLAGGIQRLVRIDEETDWIHRGWTLQEAIAPPTVSVLFSWKLGSGLGSAGDNRNVELKEVVRSKSAMTSLSLVIDASVTGSLSFTGEARKFTVEVKIFGSHPSNFSYNDVPFWRPQRKLLSPNVAALAVILNDVLDHDAKEYAIWQSALMRTSSRPVDMIFSIMGLFGITLNTVDFHKNDRVGATIALAREILRKGGRANWLGASFKLEPARQISTFPTFPQTRVAGKALVSTRKGVRDVLELMSSEYPYGEALVYMPKGTMDSEGYLHFSAKAIEISIIAGTVWHSKNPLGLDHLVQVTTMDDGSVREILHDSSQAMLEQTSVSRTFLVLIGWFNAYYPGATPANDAQNIRTMVVEEHSVDKFHVQKYCSLSMKLRSWVSKWETREICVGGPEALADPEVMGDTDGELQETFTEVGKLRLPTSSSWKPTLKDQTLFAARWAVPQKVLEEHLSP